MRKRHLCAQQGQWCNIWVCGRSEELGSSVATVGRWSLRSDVECARFGKAFGWTHKFWDLRVIQEPIC
eukprot:10633775-Lingulodinium_polyedra.AAC.1